MAGSSVRINEIVLEKRSVTADTALRLARYFGTSAAFWLGLQAEYDMRKAELKRAPILGKIRPVSASKLGMVRIRTPRSFRPSPDYLPGDLALL
jgi:plasmid maintenance system antidote protein VapI